jgi:hypothetical protein
VPDDYLPHTLFTDSEACMGMAKNPVNYKKNKQVMLKYHWTRHAVNNKELRLKYIPTEYQIADILTKTMKRVSDFHSFRNAIVHHRQPSST